MADGFYDVDSKWSPLLSQPFTPKRSLFAFLLCNSLWSSITADDYNPWSAKSDIIKKYQSEIAFIESQLKDDDANGGKLEDSIKENLITEREKRLALIENEMLYSQSSSTSSDFAWDGWRMLKENKIEKIHNNLNCDRSTNLNSCPLSTYLSKVFHIIINDYVNSKIANIYGNMSELSIQDEIKEWQIQTGINNFSDYYFSKCGSITGNSEFIYINKDQVDGGDKNYCSHPNTYKVLSNYIENSYQKTKNNKIISYDILNNEVSRWSFLWSSLLSNCSKWDDGLDCALDDFRHLMLNELMFYGLFMEFYGHYVVSSEQFWPLTIGKDKIVTQEILDEEWWKAQVELEVATNAIQQDFKIIRNLFAKFPIHIALVAYLEDLVRFRNTLVKLYTPIHQMYYKLRNTQTYER